MINIIGAGMAGSILAKLLKIDGIEYRIFDAEKIGRSSTVSENLIGSTWYTKEYRKFALDVLNSIVPVRFINSGKQCAHHVYVSDLLEYNYMVGNAHPCKEGTIFGSTLYKGTNVICTGVWAKDFVDVRAVAGHGYIFEGIGPEWIRGDYKPYRHLKFIEFDHNRMWFGNSCIINQGKYWEDRTRYAKELRDIAIDSGVITSEHEPPIYFGYRPAMNTGRHQLAIRPEVIKVEEGFVITGGFKSGMVEYPRMCMDMLEIIKTKGL